MKSVRWGRAKDTAAHGASANRERSASTGTPRLWEEGGSLLGRWTPAAWGWAITTTAGVWPGLNSKPSIRPTWNYFTDLSAAPQTCAHCWSVCKTLLWSCILNLFEFGCEACFLKLFISLWLLRNPDGDSAPWCYIYRGTQVNWEFCSLPKCREGTARSKRSKQKSSKSDSLDRSDTSFLCFEQTGSRSACRAWVSRTEAPRLWPGAALAACPGTPPHWSASPTTLGDLMRWIWGWPATTSAGSNSWRLNITIITIVVMNIGTSLVFIAYYLLFLTNRNPDGDVGPWCYTYKDLQLTWELCDLPKCSESLDHSNQFIPSQC